MIHFMGDCARVHHAVAMRSAPFAFGSKTIENIGDRKTKPRPITKIIIELKSIFQSVERRFVCAFKIRNMFTS